MLQNSPSATVPPDGVDDAPPRRSESPLRQTARRLLADRIGRIAVGGLALLTFVAIAAPWIAPYDPTAIDLRSIMHGPSWDHWLGTDEIGRDILSRIIYATRIAVLVIIVSIGLSIIGGAVIGVIAGYVGGWIDSVLMRLMDGLLAFPTLILALGIVAALGPSLTNALIAIAIVNVPNFARLVRGEVLALREADFVQASRAIGMPVWRIMAGPIRRHFMGTLLIYATLRASVAIITEASLSFLGLGAQPPTPTWGGMIATGLSFLNRAWWLGVIPGVALFLTVLLLNFLGDALRDALDTKLSDRGDGAR